MTKKEKPQQIVTKDYLVEKINKNPIHTVGRILVALFRLQEEDERGGNLTRHKNGVGFSANDARLGSIGAKYFIKHKTLTEGLVKGWLKKDKFGRPRIVKYSRQLNDIAMANKTKIPNENNHTDLTRVP